ncbi:MAG: DUF7347 domain-containing protein [Candidatus Hodarchaeales archaeon]
MVVLDDTTKFFEIFSHPIRLNIVKQLNIGSMLFSDLMTSAKGTESSKFNFHLKKLIKTNIILKKDKSYQLTVFGLKALHFIEAFESDEFTVNESFDIEKLDHEDVHVAHKEIIRLDQIEKSIFLPERPIGLPPSVRSFNLFVGKNASLMEKKYYLPLPNPLELNENPRSWIKKFIKPLNQLIEDKNAVKWLEDRFLKLAFGTRGLQDYGLMDASLAVPPLKTTINPLKDTLKNRGKAGLFATTGMGKSRILLYLASWWIRTFETQVVFIENPKDMSEKDWDVLLDILSRNISGSRDNPRWLVIVEDVHLIELKKMDLLKRVIAGAGTQSWSILIAFTETTHNWGSLSPLNGQEPVSSIQILKNEFQPLEISHYLNLSLLWSEWRPFFHEWIQWVALDVLVDVIPWEKRSWKKLDIKSYKSPWAFVVSLGFLKNALTNLQETITDNIFPLVLYSTIAQFYILREEQGIEQSYLLEMIENYFGQDLLDIYPQNNWKNETLTLLNRWTDPRIRLIPPMNYKKISGSLRKEPIVSFYHQEWAREVCNLLLNSKNSDIFEFVVKLFEHLLPIAHILWKKIKDSMENKKYDFLHWLRLNVRVELNKLGQPMIVHLKINDKESLYLKDFSISKEMLKTLNNIQMLNWTFIKSVIANNT